MYLSALSPCSSSGGQCLLVHIGGPCFEASAVWSNGPTGVPLAEHQIQAEGQGSSVIMFL